MYFIAPLLDWNTQQHIGVILLFQHDDDSIEDVAAFPTSADAHRYMEQEFPSMREAA